MIKKKMLYLLIFALSIFLIGCKKDDYGNFEGIEVKYELNGGVFQNCTLPITQYYTFKEGARKLIIDPMDASKEVVLRSGYTFDGWYTEDNKLWDFKTDEITDDGITLYANWKLNIKHAFQVCYKENDEIVVLGKYDVWDDESAIFDDMYNYANKRSGYTAIGFVDENGDPWDNSYVHPRPEDKDLVVNVYVNHIKGNYEVCKTANELQKAVNQKKNIYLMNDIDMTTSTSSDGNKLNFGDFDKQLIGNNYTISNAKVVSTIIRNSYVDYNEQFVAFVSLFGSLNKAKIENVTFSNVRYEIDVRFCQGRHVNIYIGGFAKDITNSTIENVKVSASYTINANNMPEYSEDNVLVFNEISIINVTDESVIKDNEVSIVKMTEKIN